MSLTLQMEKSKRCISVQTTSSVAVMSLLSACMATQPLVVPPTETVVVPSQESDEDETFDRDGMVFEPPMTGSEASDTEGTCGGAWDAEGRCGSEWDSAESDGYDVPSPSVTIGSEGQVATPSLTLVPPDDDVVPEDALPQFSPIEARMQEIEARIQEIEDVLIIDENALLEIADSELVALRMELAFMREEALPASSLPVYNLEIYPLESPAPISLKPGVETRVIFSIGPHQQVSVLPPNSPISTDITELAEEELLLADSQTLELNVTLNCIVCSNNNYQRGSLQYDAEKRRSTANVEFVIRADSTRVDQDSGVGTLLFTVDARGIDLDVINVPVFVGAPSTTQIAQWTKPKVRQIQHDRVLSQTAPDLVINIGDAPGALSISLIPHLAELRNALAAELEGDEQEVWTFDSGVSKEDLDGLVRDAYFEQRAMIEQGEVALQEVYARFDRDVDLSDGAARLIISDADRNKMLKVMRSNGARLYKRTFLRGDRDLRKAMQLLEDFETSDGKPLRVQIDTSNVYAPWQLLYTGRASALASVTRVKPDLFWGFRYELGTRVLIKSPQAPLQTIMDVPTIEQTMFAAYRGSSAADEVAARARSFSEHIAGRLGHPDDQPLDLTDSRDEFLDQLREKGSSLRLIIAYGHASSGTTISASPGGGAIPHDEIAGTWFRFNADDYVQPRDIDELTPLPGEGLLLDAQPIVFFNACETGAGGNRPMNNNGFVGALTRAGARAVIVTETPVWNNFAYHFGTRIMDLLLDGKPVQTALRDARLHHLEEWNNPLGLVYTLYGNPAAQIVNN